MRDRIKGNFGLSNFQCRSATAGHGPGHGLRRPEAAAWGRPGLRPRVSNRRPRQRPGAMMAWGHARPGHRPSHMFMKWPSQCTWKNLVLIAYYMTCSNSVPPDFFSNSRPRIQYVLSQVLNLVLEPSFCILMQAFGSSGFLLPLSIKTGIFYQPTLSSAKWNALSALLGLAGWIYLS
jgi:hypothetical protein